jgi:hypothetical protein
MERKKPLATQSQARQVAIGAFARPNTASQAGNEQKKRAIPLLVVAPAAVSNRTSIFQQKGNPPLHSALPDPI